MQRTVMYDRIRRTISEPRHGAWEASDQDKWANGLDLRQMRSNFTAHYEAVRSGVDLPGPGLN